MFRIKQGIIGLCTLVVMSLSVSVARADSFHATGTNDNGNPYDITATITQSGSQLTVVLTNNINNQMAVDQSISGLIFHVSGFGGTAFSGFSGNGRLGTFNSTTQVWDDVGGNSAADALSWGLSSQGLGTFKLITNFPKQTIAGVPNSSTGTTFNYNPDANASLENGAHQPIIAQSATFVFTVTGLPPNAHFDGVIFFIGTTPEDVLCTDCQTTETPEPASMLLLGTGLAGAAAGLRRRLRKGRS